VTAPDGNWNDHVDYLVKIKIQPWNTSISASYLHRHDVYRSATTVIFKSIDYMLPVTSVFSKQCHAINIRLHKTFLPRISVDIHLPLVYRYVPSHYQGLNSLHSEEKQFNDKFKMFLYHMNTTSQLA